MGAGGNDCFNIKEKENKKNENEQKNHNFQQGCKNDNYNYDIKENENCNSAKVNVIYFDQTIFEKETHLYFTQLKKLVKGSIFGTGDYKLLEKVFELIDQSKNPPPFVLITSGSMAEKILNDFHSKAYLYDVLIFCYYNNKYEYLKNKYEKIRMIESIEFTNILNFLKSKDYNLAQDTEGATYLKNDPLITFKEYEDYYYQYHHFIIQNYSENCLKLTEKDKNDFLSCIDETNISCSKKILNELENNEDFFINIIKIYTKESPICYTLNKLLRRLNNDAYNSIKNYACSTLYSLYKYVSLNIEYGKIEKTLYRQITMKFTDILLYKVCEGEIICYPGFTSACYRKIFPKFNNENNDVDNNDCNDNENNNNDEEEKEERREEYEIRADSERLEEEREPTKLAKEIVYENDDIYDCVDIFIECNENKYYPSAINISNISDTKFEEERLFPAFSFFKIKKVNILEGKNHNPHIITLEVVYKKYNLEEKMFKGERVYLDSDTNLLMTRIITNE